MTEQRWGFWECPECKTENTGKDHNCHVCGTSQPYGKDVFYERSKKTGELGPLCEEHEESEMPDWQCVSCNSMNEHSWEQCHHCGTSRVEYSSNAVYNDSDVSVDGVATYHSLLNDMERKAEKEQIRSNIREYLFWGGIALAVLVALWGIIYMATRPEKVASLRWECTTSFYKNVTLSRQGFHPDNGAYQVAFIGERVERIDKVKVGTVERVVEYYGLDTVGYNTITKTKKVFLKEICKDSVVYEASNSKKQSKNLGNGRFSQESDKPKSKTVRTCRKLYDNVKYTVNEPITKTVKKHRSVYDPVYQDVPVYSKFYSWKLDELQKTGQLQCSGESNPKPCSQEPLSRSNIRFVVVDEDGDEYDSDESFWRTLKKGSEFGTSFGKAVAP